MSVARRVLPTAGSSGFTLLEVMVALFILAILAVTVSQSLYQRTAIALTQQQRLPLILCARSLESEFAIERYWPDLGHHEGPHAGQASQCHWQLEVEETGLPEVRRGTLQVSAPPAPRPLRFTVFLAP